MNSINDCYVLNNGMMIPCIGFGTYKVNDSDSTEIILHAIEAGYRYFDSATMYENEVALGEAIKESNIPREDFFVVSKLWSDQLGYENAKTALNESLEKLQMDYVDMYLIHWPRNSENNTEWKELNIQTWKALEDMYKLGKTRALGVSNFLPHHIDNILKNCEIKPVINQLELHPGYMQLATVKYCEAHNILLQAWSPLARQQLNGNRLMTMLSEKYQVSISKVCLRFLLQMGIHPLPKASSLERMKENLDVFHFEIEQEDMYRILTMPECGWSGNHPDPEITNKKPYFRVRNV